MRANAASALTARPAVAAPSSFRYKSRRGLRKRDAIEHNPSSLALRPGASILPLSVAFFAISFCHFKVRTPCLCSAAMPHRFVCASR
ncbi:MAG: hypothetical protein CFK52_13445 [Chloracidobacterium sp. CP2_5A]|nr:MAG: hypothetical protein CFK52_13445 [Chloracidobacterium sp. CP2_5A]